MSTPDLGAIRRRLEARTPGDWKCWNCYGLSADGYMRCERVGPKGEGGISAPLPGNADMWGRREDFEFAASAPADIRALLEEVGRLQGMLARCYEAAGADPDGNEDWRLAEHAVGAVQELREEHDAEADHGAELTRLRARVAELEQALEFYAYRDHYGCEVAVAGSEPVMRDGGAQAREALDAPQSG